MGNTLLWILGIGIVGYFIWIKYIAPGVATGTRSFVHTLAHGDPKKVQQYFLNLERQFPSQQQAHYAYYD